MPDILEQLDRAWTEDFKANLMHFCDLAAQEIRRTRAEILRLEEDLDRMGEILHATEAERDRLRAKLALRAERDPPPSTDAPLTMSQQDISAALRQTQSEER